MPNPSNKVAICEIGSATAPIAASLADFRGPKARRRMERSSVRLATGGAMLYPRSLIAAGGVSDPALQDAPYAAAFSA